MDLVCSLQRPNLLSGSEGMSRKTLDRFDSYILLRSRYFTCNVRCSSRTGKKGKKIMSFSGFETASLAAREKFDSHCVISLDCRTSFFCNFCSAFGGRKAVWSRCQGNDSLAYVNGNRPNAEFLESSDESGRETDYGGGLSGSREEGGEREGEKEAPSLDELRELLQKAITELEVARLNSTMFEEKAQRISEAAIALQDEAMNAWTNVNSTLHNIQPIVNEESVAKEDVQKATMALSLQEARLQVAVESLEAAKGGTESPDISGASGLQSDVTEDERALLDAQQDIRECQVNLANCEAELKQLQSKKEELQKEVDRLNEIAERTQLDVLKAEEDVTSIMLLAEQAVAFELEAMQCVNDAEIALQKAEKTLSSSNVDITETDQGQLLSDDTIPQEEERVIQGSSEDISVEWDRDVLIDGDFSVVKTLPDSPFEKTSQSSEDLDQTQYLSDHENRKLTLDSQKEADAEAEKSKSVVQSKKARK